MPTITQLEYILAVSRMKHFSRAAIECHVSQPSLSAQIQKVEEQLGFVIFDRSKNPVLVTRKGEEFISQAKNVLREHRKLLCIQSESKELKGTFNLGVIPTLSASIIPLFIEQFSKKYPGVYLSISEYKTEEILSRLYDDRLDGGLLVTPLYDDKIIERSLFFEPFYVFVSESSDLYNRKTVKDEDLRGDEIWLLNEGHCFRDQVLRLCATKNDSHVFHNINFESGNFETLKNLIRIGLGCTLLPYLSTLNLTLNEKNKNLKPFRKPVPTREVSLVHSRSFLKEEIIMALEKEITAAIPDELKSLKRDKLSIIDI